MEHRWHFFWAGGVDQVSLRDSGDLLALRELDQKLWIALSMPLEGIHLAPESLAIFDEDRDGRIRVQDHPRRDRLHRAINGRARINVAFGARMTELAVLPKGSQRSLDDPFADKRTPWKRWVLLILLVIAGVSWWKGKLDRFLPTSIRSVEVLGESAAASPNTVPPSSATPAAS